MIPSQFMRLLTRKVLIFLLPCTSTSMIAFLVIVDLDPLIAVNKDLGGISSVGILCRSQNCAEIGSAPTVQGSIKTLALALLILISAAFYILLLSGNECILLSVGGFATCREEVFLSSITTLADLILGPGLYLTCVVLLLIFFFEQSVARCPDCL